VENVRLTDRFNIHQQIIGKNTNNHSFFSLIYFSLCLQGTIYLTATHLIFIDPEGKREIWVTGDIKNFYKKKLFFP